MKLGEPCKKCQRPITQDVLDKLQSARGAKVSEGLRRAQLGGISIGRPRTANYDEIRACRAQGLSLRQIAKKLGVSRSSVHRAIAASDYKKTSEKL